MMTENSLTYPVLLRESTEDVKLSIKLSLPTKTVHLTTPTYMVLWEMDLTLNWASIFTITPSKEVYVVAMQLSGPR